MSGPYIEEIKFEMEGHTIVAWLPATGQTAAQQQDQDLDPGLRRPRDLERWFLEIDGSSPINGPLYTRLPLGCEEKAEAVLRAFLMNDPNLLTPEGRNRRRGDRGREGNTR